MQRYPDSGPSNAARRTEGFAPATATAPMPASSGSTTATSLTTVPPPITFGSLLNIDWYKKQYTDLSATDIHYYLDTPVDIPYLSILIGTPTVSIFVFYTHIILACLAIYFSVRARCGFNAAHFTSAAICPYLYIPFYLSIYGFHKVCAQNIKAKRNAQALNVESE
jgi:hypothetical protein